MTQEDGLFNDPIPEPDPLIYLLDAEVIPPNRLYPFLAAPPAEAAAHGAAAVAEARTQVGVRESGGEDRGVPYQRYVQYFGSSIPPSPWCAFFVSWCFAVTHSPPPWSNRGYVPSVYSWAQAHGALVSTPAHG